MYKNLDIMNIDKARKRKRVCKNCQIYVDILKIRLHNTVSCQKTGNKDKQTQNSSF